MQTTGSMAFGLLVVLSVVTLGSCGKYMDDNDPKYTSTDPSVREPRPCEVCKYLVTELQTRLDKSGKSKEVLQIGQQFDSQKRKVPYKYSELRLTEALHEPHICENILKYNVHAEREGSLRYAKGMSETFSTLHGLVNKGVDVKMDIPYELWDEPSAEVTKMHRACFNLVEHYEEDIEDWYYNDQDANLADYICRQRYLKDRNGNPTCLDEKPETDEERKARKKAEKKAKKDKKGKKKNLKGETGSLSDLKKDEL